ncbi:MAG: hypothetical protein H7A48_12495 [Akkermansiaceae bacterium]|nr:hypothetical protein [Akkermansiaceae bacterium]
MYLRVLTPAVVVLSLLAALPAEGQGARVRLRFLAFQSGVAPGEAYLHDPAGPDGITGIKVGVKNYLNHQSDTITLSSRKFALTRSGDRDSLTREGERITEATLPEGVRTAIVLLLPGGPGEKTSCRSLVINDDKKEFPLGSFHISNLSPAPVRLVLEKKKFDFKPGDTQVIKDPPVRENQHSGMEAFALKDEEWRRIASGMWPKPDRGRVLQVLFARPVTGQIQLRAFDDVPPRPFEETAPVN